MEFLRHRPSPHRSTAPSSDARLAVNCRKSGRATMLKSTTRVFLLFFVSTQFLVTAPLHGQTDQELFAQGRIAFDRYNDCRGALNALGRVSQALRNDSLWVLYMAKTHECLQNYGQAIRYYRRYNDLAPGRTEIIDKIGEMLYLAGRRKEPDRTRSQGSPRSATVVSGAWSVSGVPYRLIHQSICRRSRTAPQSTRTGQPIRSSL